MHIAQELCIKLHSPIYLCHNPKCLSQSSACHVLHHFVVWTILPSFELVSFFFGLSHMKEHFRHGSVFSTSYCRVWRVVVQSRLRQLVDSRPSDVFCAFRIRLPQNRSRLALVAFAFFCPSSLQNAHESDRHRPGRARTSCGAVLRGDV